MKFKKILSIFLSLVLVLSVFAGLEINAYAATSGTSGGVNWNLDKSTGAFTITKSGNGRGADYSKYQFFGGNNQPWYNDRKSIKTVNVEEGVVQIGSYWFYDCTNLTSVNFNSSTLDTLGDDLFRGCTSLQSINLPENATYYYSELFLDCTSLKYVSLPSTNNTDNYKGKIPNGTFKGCTSLEQVYVGSGHTGMDVNAFNGCSKLKGIVWTSGNLSSVASSALTGVSSSCKLVGASSLVNATSALSFQNVNGFCGTALSYKYDAQNKKLSVLGSGDMTSNPWSVYSAFITELDFSGTNGNFTIMSGAFQNLINSTFWVNIPSNCTQIGSNAFYNANFNYNRFLGDKITIGNNAFGNGSSSYARFFGIANSGVRDYVKAGQAKGYDWHYYCLDDKHNYVTKTVAPTCVEKGYDLTYCTDCDTDEVKSNYTDVTGHKYEYTGTNGPSIVYKCNVCGKTNLQLDALALVSNFKTAITTDDKAAAYTQSNYDSKYDLNHNGFINAKDYSMLSKIINNIDTTNKQTTIDTSTAYQTIEGFGASAAWWAQYVGGWDNLDEIMELLYSKEKGAGLSIYRYNLGTGSQDDTHITDVDRRTQGFLQKDGTYDWSRDANAQKALASAQKANKDLKVTLFSNSAPVWLTKNGKAYCSNGANSNLDPSNYDAFAQFVVKCSEHFIDEGYNVTEVSPINEPEWAWAADTNGNAGQEGSHWEDTAARNFYNNAMIPAIKKSEKLNGRVGVDVWECAQLNHSTYFNGFLNNMFSSSDIYPNYYGRNNANIRDYVDSLGTHSYWASTSDREKVASTLAGNALTNNYTAVKKVRCTEYCQMTNDGNSGVYGLIQKEGTTNGLGIEYGLALADIMHQDLTILNAVEWDWWVAVGPGVYPDALVYVNKNNHNDIQTSKRLWVMGNYARFIEDGAKRVSVSTGSNFGKNLVTNTTYSWKDGNTTRTDKNNYIEQTAYQNPDGTVVVVYINNSDTNEYTKFSSSDYKKFETYVTDESRDLEKYQSGNTNVAVSIPAKSVTTVVLTPNAQ